MLKTSLRNNVHSGTWNFPANVHSKWEGVFGIVLRTLQPCIEASISSGRDVPYLSHLLHSVEESAISTSAQSLTTHTTRAEVSHPHIRRVAKENKICMQFAFRALIVWISCWWSNLFLDSFNPQLIFLKPKAHLPWPVCKLTSDPSFLIISCLIDNHYGTKQFCEDSFEINIKNNSNFKSFYRLLEQWMLIVIIFLICWQRFGDNSILEILTEKGKAAWM